LIKELENKLNVMEDKMLEQREEYEKDIKLFKNKLSNLTQMSHSEIQQGFQLAISELQSLVKHNNNNNNNNNDNNDNNVVVV